MDRDLAERSVGSPNRPRPHEITHVDPSPEKRGHRVHHSCPMMEITMTIKSHGMRYGRLNAGSAFD